MHLVHPNYCQITICVCVCVCVCAAHETGNIRHTLIPESLTVFIRIVAAATINFTLSFVRLLIEGGSYSRAATITARQYRARARTRNNCVRTYVYERACPCPPYDIAL